MYLKAPKFCLFTLIPLAGCLDIPDAPSDSRQVERIGISVSQENSDSTLLKIRPGDTATLNTEIYPRQYRSDLSFQWIYVDSLSRDSSILGRKDKYGISPEAIDSIPNVLKVTDSEGNSQTIAFHVIVNTPPSFSEESTPADQDTLYGNSRSSFLFQWETSSNDEFLDDVIYHTLILDGNAKDVGKLTQVYQSGFSEGKHTFCVIATDAFGDSDTLETRTFYVLDTLGGSL